MSDKLIGYTYDWQVRRLSYSKHGAYSVRCIVCGKRHMLRAIDIRDGHDTVRRRYTLTQHPGSIEASWSQSELDRMAEK